MITLIGKDLAKKGQEFVFLGPADECDSCRFKSSCVGNLELNRKSFYTTRYDLTGINKIEYEEVIFLNKDQLFSEITTILDNPQRFTNNIMITLPRLPKNKLDDFTTELEQFIKHNDLLIIY